MEPIGKQKLCIQSEHRLVLIRHASCAGCTELAHIRAQSGVDPFFAD